MPHVVSPAADGFLEGHPSGGNSTGQGSPYGITCLRASGRADDVLSVTVRIREVSVLQAILAFNVDCSTLYGSRILGGEHYRGKKLQ